MTDEPQGITHGLSAETLLGRAVRGARRRRGRGNARHMRWEAVMEVFGLGSTAAWELCKHFGVNPEEKVTRWA